MGGYYGTYRGVVIDTGDPEGKGRLQVEVPDVTGPTAVWAVPEHDGATVPAAGDYVVIRYESGDEWYPIWASDGSAPTGPEAAEDTDGRGTFRGTVLDNADPEGRSRLVVEVPDLWPGQPVWANPEMSAESVPDVGAAVWIRFDQGDYQYPVWSA